MSMFVQLGTLKSIQNQRLERAENEVKRQLLAVREADELYQKSLKRYEIFKAENQNIETEMLESVMRKRAQKMKIAELPQRIEKIKKELALLKQESDEKEAHKNEQNDVLTNLEGEAKRFQNKFEAFSILVDEEKQKLSAQEVLAEDAQIDEFVETRSWGPDT